MWRAVLIVLDQYATVWNSTGAFVTAYNELKALILILEKDAGTQLTADEGVVTDRDMAENMAVNHVLDLAGAIKAYAIDKDDAVLYAHVAVPRSSIERLPDNEQYAKMAAMMEAIRPLGGSTAAYGVTPALVTAADAALEHYKKVMVAPRAATADISAATTNIPVILRQGRKVLDKMDGLIRRFRATSPKFVSAYGSARIIVDAGIRHDPAVITPTSTRAAAAPIKESRY